MAVQADPADPAAEAYEALAPFYDRFTAAYEYEGWLDGLETLARRHGLTGRRLLDVGCGTGKSFEPMLRRGYEVTACDISPAMVKAAQAKLCSGPGRALVADMRCLPDLGQFDLITCLDDALNYLLDATQVLGAFRSVRRLLAPAGVYVFDTNSLGTYQRAFSREFALDAPKSFFCWRGEGDQAARPGVLASAKLEIFADEGDGRWRRSCSRHTQRHYSATTIHRLLSGAGLSCCVTVGQSAGATLHDAADELAHNKIVFLASPADTGRRNEAVA